MTSAGLVAKDRQVTNNCRLQNSSEVGTIQFMNVLNVSQAALRLGVSDRRVRQMLERGELEGQRVGLFWIIDPMVVERARRHHTRSLGRVAG